MNLEGQTIGYWTVIKYLGKNKAQSRLWECKCSCGKIKPRTTAQLNTPYSCGCSRKNTYGNIPSYLWSNIKISATRRKINFNLTSEQAWFQFEKQNGICSLSGLKLYFSEQSNRSLESTASLDRIDSTNGYNKNNIQWIHKDINIMKGQLSVTKYIEYCKLVTYPLLKQKSEYKIYVVGGIWDSLRSNAKRRKIDIEITKDELIDLFYKQEGQCNITNLPLTLPKNYKDFRSFNYTSSIDRIDSSKNYTRDNIQWLHKDINKMKMHFNQNYFTEISKIVTKYLC